MKEDEVQFRDALMMLRSRETYHNQADYSITTDETKLRKLFDDIDFGENGRMNEGVNEGQAISTTVNLWQLAQQEKKV